MRVEFTPPDQKFIREESNISNPINKKEFVSNFSIEAIRDELSRIKSH